MLQRKPLILFLFAAVLLTGCRPPTPPFTYTDAIGCVKVVPRAPPQDWGNQLLGHPVELVAADSRCLREGRTTATLKITADPQIVGIVGPTCSGEARWHG